MKVVVLGSTALKDLVQEAVSGIPGDSVECVLHDEIRLPLSTFWVTDERPGKYKADGQLHSWLKRQRADLVVASHPEVELGVLAHLEHLNGAKLWIFGSESGREHYIRLGGVWGDLSLPSPVSVEIIVAHLQAIQLQE